MNTVAIQDKHADRNAKVEALRERLEEQVETLTTGEGWAAMLATAAKFHRYSVGNQLLIQLQCPGATMVAGFHDWRKKHNRSVRKGETGIAIFAPVTRRVDADDPDEQKPADKTTGRTARTAVVGVRIVYVFDISQTDGDPVPTRPRPVLLEGEIPAGLWETAAAQVAAHGYTLHREPCGQANGVTRPDDRTVIVRPDVDDRQAFKTLVHEIAHILLDHVADMDEYRQHRGRCEVEAESVAYIVAGALDLDTSAYTVPYVAGWAGNTATEITATVKASADRVLSTARAILAPFDQDQAAAA